MNGENPLEIWRRGKPQSQEYHSHQYLTSIPWHTATGLPNPRTGIQPLSIQMLGLAYNQCPTPILFLLNFNIVLDPTLQTFLETLKLPHVSDISGDGIPHTSRSHQEWLPWQGHFKLLDSQCPISCTSRNEWLELWVHVHWKLSCSDSPNLQNRMIKYQLLYT